MKVIFLFNMANALCNLIFYMFKNCIYTCDGKAEFSAHINLVSNCSTEIIIIYCFGTQETFNINFKNSCAA